MYAQEADGVTTRTSFGDEGILFFFAPALIQLMMTARSAAGTGSPSSGMSPDWIM